MLTSKKPAGRSLCPEASEPPEKLFARVLLPTLTTNGELGLKLVEVMVAARQAMDAINGVLDKALLTETDKAPLREAAAAVQAALDSVA